MSRPDEEFLFWACAGLQDALQVFEDMADRKARPRSARNSWRGLTAAISAPVPDAGRLC